jgi:PII-like signaling protein
MHLRFYTYENRRHGAKLEYEWLLEFAKAHGVHGGSAFRAIAGYGRHGVMSEQRFFELAGQQTVLVEFIVSEQQADELVRIAREDGAPLFYARFPAEFGLVSDAEGAQR